MSFPICQVYSNRGAFENDSAGIPITYPRFSLFGQVIPGILFLDAVWQNFNSYINLMAIYLSSDCISKSSLFNGDTKRLRKGLGDLCLQFI